MIEKIKTFYKLKIDAKIKQYGIKYVIKESFLKLLRLFYNKNSYVLLVSTKEKIKPLTQSYIKLNDIEHLNEVLINNTCAWDIKQNVLFKMLTRKEDVHIITIDNIICAYAATQKSGDYSFGKNSKIKIPENIAIFKNLYVSIDYRGKKLGKVLNIERINNLSSNYIRLVLVQKENTIAINNWYKLEFRKISDITQITLLKKYTKNKIDFIDSSNKYTSIRKAFNELS